MGLKTTFSLVAATTVAIAAYQAVETRQQVFYACEGKAGHVELLNPNRYTGHTDLHIVLTSSTGHVQHYRPLKTTALELANEAREICRTGKLDAGLRLDAA